MDLPGHDIMKGLGKIIATPKYGNEAVLTCDN